MVRAGCGTVGAHHTSAKVNRVIIGIDALGLTFLHTLIAASAQVGVNVKMVERSAAHDSQRSADWADDVAKCASTATIGHP